MSKILNAFTPKTAQNLQLDAGILVKNHTVGEAIADENKLGATSGGSTFTAIPEFRNLFDDIDGARGSYKGGTVIDNWDIKLTATVKEITAENIKLALGAVDKVAGEQSAKYDKMVPRLEIKDTDYLNNLCWIGTINGSAEPLIIELKDVLNTNGITLTATDKGTGTIALELTAHFNLESPEVVPFIIHTPKATV